MARLLPFAACIGLASAVSILPFPSQGYYEGEKREGEVKRTPGPGCDSYSDCSACLSGGPCAWMPSGACLDDRNPLSVGGTKICGDFGVNPALPAEYDDNRLFHYGSDPRNINIAVSKSGQDMFAEGVDIEGEEAYLGVDNLADGGGGIIQGGSKMKGREDLSAFRNGEPVFKSYDKENPAVSWRDHAERSSGMDFQTDFGADTQAAELLAPSSKDNSNKNKYF